MQEIKLCLFCHQPLPFSLNYTRNKFCSKKCYNCMIKDKDFSKASRKKRSETMKRKIAEGEIVRKLPDGCQQRWNDFRRGKTFEEIFGIDRGLRMRKDITKRLLGHPTSEATKIKIGLKHKGKIISLEAREKIRQANLGKKYSDATKLKHSISMKSRPNAMQNPILCKLQHDKIKQNYVDNPELRQIRSKQALKMFQDRPEIAKKMSEKTKQRYIDHPELKEFYRQKMIKMHREDVNYQNILKEVRKKLILPTNESSIELALQNFLIILNIPFEKHRWMDIKQGYQSDIFIPSMNLVIEADGVYWHGHPDYYPILTENQIMVRDKDYVKTDQLIKKGFRVLRLWEDEINRMDLDDFKNRIEPFNYYEVSL